MQEFELRGAKVVVKRADITEEDCTAIVNPANSQMVMGGGVAGAIKRKGGEEIEREAMAKAPVPIGSAILTGAGRLKAKYVIHTPTMERPGGRATVEVVEKAARAAFELACREGIDSLAIPALGAGVGGVPIRESARAILRALDEVLERARGLEEVRLVARSQEAYEEMLAACKEFFESRGQ